MHDVTRDLLVHKMVGRDIVDVYSYTPREAGEAVLEVKGVMGDGLSAPANLSVRRGEIVGVFGLVGAGRTELLNLIYGARRRAAGEIVVDGAAAEISDPTDAIRAGVVLCPEDRKALGIVPVRSVKENVNLSARRNWLRLGLFVNEQWERANAREKVDQLKIRTPSLEQAIVHLSGGNQQKAILARWLSERVKVVLFDEPTRGIDVGAKSEIYSIMTKLAEQGVGILMVSSELPEVLGISDRILVMRQGTIVASLSRDEATRERVLELALPAAETEGVA
jgi:L-arabinose transport system ATP-binding protein